MKKIKGLLIAYLILTYAAFLVVYLPSWLGIDSDNENYQIFLNLFLIILILNFIIFIVTLAFEIRDFYKKILWNSKNMVLFISIIKTLLIPAYFLNFIIGLGMFMMGFFTGITWLAVPIIIFISFSALIITSLVNIKCLWDEQKNNKFTFVESLILSITQVCFVIDYPLSWFILLKL